MRRFFITTGILALLFLTTGTGCKSAPPKEDPLMSGDPVKIIHAVKRLVDRNDRTRSGRLVEIFSETTDADVKLFIVEAFRLLSERHAVRFLIDVIESEAESFANVKSWAGAVKKDAKEKDIPLKMKFPNRVAFHAIYALERITGVKHPYKMSEDKTGIKGRWSDWWEHFKFDFPGEQFGVKTGKKKELTTEDTEDTEKKKKILIKIKKAKNK
jgi:hypothetical protein